LQYKPVLSGTFKSDGIRAQVETLSAALASLKVNPASTFFTFVCAVLSSFWQLVNTSPKPLISSKPLMVLLIVFVILIFICVPTLREDFRHSPLQGCHLHQLLINNNFCRQHRPLAV